MNLGIGSHSFGWKVGVSGYAPEKPMTPIDLFFWSKKLGVNVVQIADNMPLHLLKKENLRTLLLEATMNNISIEIGMRGLLPVLLDQYIEIASFLKSNLIRVVIDLENYKPTLNEIVLLLNGYKSILSERGIVLGIENHDRLSSESLVKVLETVNSESIGICLDTANSLGAGEGIETIINKLGPWTVNLHIKDFIIRRIYHKMGFIVEGCPAGEGQLNIPEILKSLSIFHRDQISAIIELWTPPEETVKETIAKEEEWLTKSVVNLRKFIAT